MNIQFAKLHADQSDYIVTAHKPHSLENAAELAKKMCNRKTGIGADGIAFIEKIDGKFVHIRLFNPDASEAHFGENAARCTFEYILHSKLYTCEDVFVNTPYYGCSIKRLQRNLFTTTIPRPSTSPESIPMRAEFTQPVINRLCEIRAEAVTLTAVNAGISYCSVFCDNAHWLRIEERAPSFVNAPIFPKGINVVFIQIVDNSCFKLSVYKRGVGEVASCGSAAAAAHSAAQLLGLCGEKAVCVFKTTAISVASSDKNSHITGEAHFICNGIYEL